MVRGFFAKDLEFEVAPLAYHIRRVRKRGDFMVEYLGVPHVREYCVVRRVRLESPYLQRRSVKKPHNIPNDNVLCKAIGSE